MRVCSEVKTQNVSEVDIVDRVMGDDPQHAIFPDPAFGLPAVPGRSAEPMPNARRPMPSANHGMGYDRSHSMDPFKSMMIVVNRSSDPTQFIAPNAMSIPSRLCRRSWNAAS